jgi:haloalkane dehalogenase
VSTAAARPAWLDETLYPFESHLLEIDGNRVHYVDEGAGPTLLFVHGNPTWSFLYREVVIALRDAFRCVAVDLVGFGLSSAAPGFSYLPSAQSAVLAQLVQLLDLQAFSVVVQDWGGPIGLSAVLVAPERLAGVVISNTWAWPVNGNPGFEKFSHLMGGPIGHLGCQYLNLFVNVLLPLSHKARRLTRAEMTHYRKPMPFGQRTATWVLPKEILASQAFLAALEARLAELSSLPALVVWGDKDDAFQQPELLRWQELLANATSVVVRGVGHFAPSEVPAEFAAAIREWHAATS